MRVLFIGGIGRSGSTLLERVLGELPDVCALGEVANLWYRVRHADERCGCGVPLAACAFWTDIGEHAFGGWDRLDLDRVLAGQRAVERIRNLPWLARRRLTGDRRAAVAEHVARYARIYAAAAAVTGARVVVDSSKSPGLAFCLRWAHDLDLRVLHLSRDPRAVAYSFTKHVPRPEADEAELMPRCPPPMTALHWNTHNAALGLLALVERRRSVRAKDGLPVHRLRYEDLLADPRGTVRRVGALAGLELATSDLDYLQDEHADLGTVHSIAGNPMRFTVGRVPLRHDDAWRAELPVRHRRIVSTLCAPLLAAYGYSMTVNPPRGRTC